MQKVADIFSLWPTDAALGRDIGVSYSTLAAWKQRQSIPAAYWREIIKAAQGRGHAEVTADLLVELHARQQAGEPHGFGEEERSFQHADKAAPTDVHDGQRGAGHFSRFRHLRRDNFKTAEEIEDHIRALRDEWSHR